MTFFREGTALRPGTGLSVLVAGVVTTAFPAPEEPPTYLLSVGAMYGVAVKGIGVGYGGPVDSARGRVMRSFHIKGWDGFELGRWFRKRFKLPVMVENDTNVAALAEA